MTVARFEGKAFRRFLAGSAKSPKRANTLENLCFGCVFGKTSSLFFMIWVPNWGPGPGTRARGQGPGPGPGKSGDLVESKKNRGEIPHSGPCSPFSGEPYEASYGLLSLGPKS